MMECKKFKKMGRLWLLCPRQKQLLPSAVPKPLGKAGKTKPILATFPALPSAYRGEGTRQRILKIFCFAECRAWGTQQKKFKIFFLCRVPCRGKIFKKKLFFIRVPGG
jgi:hypothetical protein